MSIDELEIKRLNAHIEECKHRIDNISSIIDGKDFNKEECAKNIGVLVNTVNVIEKYIEYQQLEADGRLVKLPCKVGDTVYRVDKASKKILQHKVIKFEVEQVDFDNFDYCFLHHFGKTVFLTEEEAEAKLAELRGAE